MFGSKAPKASGPGGVYDGDRQAEDLDRALDTLAGVLRCFGEYAFDTHERGAVETRAIAQDLARALLFGPNRRDPPTSQPRRDYASVRTFFDGQRRREKDFVQHGFKALRHTIELFARCLTATVAEDQASDHAVEEQLERVLGALQSNDIERVRCETGDVVRMVRHTIARRRQRDRDQLLELGQRVQALRSELDAARVQAAHDPLTQLFNRAAFDDEIARVAAFGLLLGPEPCLLLIDADHFKSVNDRHGHLAGDEALRLVADNIVRHFMRKEDFVARYGGEEFAVIVRDSTLDKVKGRAERMRQAQQDASIATSAGSLSITISVGIAPLLPGEPPEAWIARADRGLYAAKNGGRNRIEVVTPE